MGLFVRKWKYLLLHLCYSEVDHLPTGQTVSNVDNNGFNSKAS